MQRQAVALAALFAATAANAQVVTDMTPDAISEAIRHGDPSCHMLIRSEPLGCFTTPYGRVAIAAADAKEKYRPFKVEDVPADIVRPELQIMAMGTRDAKPVAIVILPAGQKDPEKAIQPTRTEPGGTVNRPALTAYFPLSALNEANEVHLVFDGERCGPGSQGKDCAIRFDLTDVK